MHLFIIIVAAILFAAFLLQPGALKNFAIGFMIPIVVLIVLALIGMAQN